MQYKSVQDINVEKLKKIIMDLLSERFHLIKHEVTDDDVETMTQSSRGGILNHEDRKKFEKFGRMLTYICVFSK